MKRPSAQARRPVALLERVLPALAELKSHGLVLNDPSRAKEHAEAARLMMTNLCANLGWFGDLKLPDFVTAEPVGPAERDRELDWIYSVGMHLDRQLRGVKLSWPPRNAKPPGIVTDLVAMYAGLAELEPDASRGERRDVAKAVDRARTHACRLATTWPPSDQLTAQGIRERGRAARIGNVLMAAVGLFGTGLAVYDVAPENQQKQDYWRPVVVDARDWTVQQAESLIDQARRIPDQ